MVESSVKNRDPEVELIAASQSGKWSTIKLGIHEQAYILKGILERIQKAENIANRSDEDETSYQFNLKLLEKLEYCRNAALPQ